MLPDSFIALKAAPLIALGGYVVLFLLGAHLLWLAERRRARPTALDGALRSPAFPWLVELLRLGYYLLLPYYALAQGLISARGLGAGEGLNWPAGILRAAGWTFVALLLLGLGWFARNKISSSHRDIEIPKTSAPRRFGDDVLLSRAAPWGWLYTLREAAYLEMSWGFYRAACIPFVGGYYAAFLGLGLVYLVGWLNPLTRVGLNLPGQRETIIHTAALALCSAVLYTQSGNLWLCFAMHALLELVLARWAKKETG